MVFNFDLRFVGASEYKRRLQQIQDESHISHGDAPRVGPERAANGAREWEAKSLHGEAETEIEFVRINRKSQIYKEVKSSVTIQDQILVIYNNTGSNISHL
jgi:hypothetical protein